VLKVVPLSSLSSSSTSSEVLEVLLLDELVEVLALELDERLVLEAALAPCISGGGPDGGAGIDFMSCSTAVRAVLAVSVSPFFNAVYRVFTSLVSVFMGLVLSVDSVALVLEVDELSLTADAMGVFENIDVRVDIAVLVSPLDSEDSMLLS